MPAHDWTRVDAGTFHAFHLAWLGQLQAELNGGVLPSGFYALAEQHAGLVIPDLLTLHVAPSFNGAHTPSPNGGSVATVTKTRPKVQRKMEARAVPKARRRTIAIRHVSGHRLVALIEIVSLANKDRRRSVTEFVNKLAGAIQMGIHVLLIDLYPPGPRDPGGMHGAVWERFDPEKPYELPKQQPLTMAAYAAGRPPVAYIDHLAVGDALPAMPLFLTAKRYVEVTLESSYAEAYRGMPAFWRDVVEGRREPTD